MPTKATTTKPAVKKPRAPRKPAAAKVHGEKPVHDAKPHHVEAVGSAAAEVTAPEIKKDSIPKGRYVFATGRRKTAIANVRLFSGKGENIVNKQPLEKHFNYTHYQEEIQQPCNLTGLGGDYYFTCHVSGGGPHAQATAVRHGIAIALSGISEEVRKILKKNGLLTRDDRKKERKKPGLKRARRSPQWAKR